MSRKTSRQLAEEKSTKRKELEAIYGEDIRHEVGTVIKFYKQFDVLADEPFTYLSIKIGDDRWFCGGEYVSWGDLLLFLDEDNVLEHGNLIDKAVAWEEVTNEPPF